MRGISNILFLGISVILLSFWSAGPKAYESYHDPNLNDDGYCASCHPGFGGGRSDSLHSLHTGNPDAVTGTCDLCHTGSGRDNPLTMWSNGDLLGCAGCHGRDYGETTQANYRGLPSSGKAKASGYGLRKHHLNNGITLCLNCHATSVEPYPESIMPPNYARADVDVTGPCNADEDTANDADSLGLDNDGDNFYEMADLDCQRGAPSRIVNLSWTPGTPDNLFWAASPDADSYQVLKGSMADLRNAGGSFAGAFCADPISLTPSYPENAVMVPGDLFYYLIRGVAGSTNGTFESDGPGQFTPRDITATACD